MMTVLINAVSAKSGGAATYVDNLARSLEDVSSSHRYLFYVPSARAHSTRPSGPVTMVPTEIGRQPAWRRLLWDQVVLRRIVRKTRADLLLSSSDFGMWCPPCRQLLLLRNPLYFSALYRRHILPKKSWRFQIEFALRAWLIRKSVASSDGVITASQSMLADVQRRIPLPASRAWVNPFGVPLEKFRRPAAAASSSPRASCRLLYVSEYSDYKNLTTLLQALLLIRQRGRGDITLTTTAHPDQFLEAEIVSRRTDRALITHPLVASHVTFTGAVPYQEVPQLYHAADLFVFPSLAESFGHPLVEAMAAGLPIIASDLPVCREICAEGAVYVDPLDPEALARTILALTDAPERRRQLGMAGETRASKTFRWSDHVDRLVGAIDRVAKGQKLSVRRRTFSYDGERRHYAQSWPRAPRPYHQVEAYLRCWMDPDTMFGGNRVLDIGAGECLYTRLIAERYAPRLVVACELFRERLLPAAREQRQHARLRFIAGDCFRLPLHDGAFQVVFGSLVLHQLPNLHDVVQEIRRVLSDGGCYVGIEPNPWSPPHLVRYLKGDHSPNQYLLGPRHLKVFTEAGFSLTIRYFCAKLPWLRGRYLGTCLGITATKSRQAGAR